MSRGLQFIILALFLASTFVFALDITMDAQRDAWWDTLTGPDNGFIYLSPNSIGQGVPIPDDEYDLSGHVWLAWDTDYLYCYAEVIDDIILVNNPTTYENDCIELKMDPDPTMEAATGISAVRLSALGEDVADDPAGVDNLIKGGELGSDWQPVEGEDYARVETDLGYNLEFRVPLADIINGDRYVDNTVGGILGLGINLMDNDEAGRSSILRWSSDMADQIWNEPPRLGTVTFLENNMVSLSTENAITGVDTNSVDYTPILAVEDKPSSAPVEYQLSQNYPNPFNPMTNITFSLPTTAQVSLVVYDLIGNEIATLMNGVTSAGNHVVQFDASELASGIYFYKLQYNNQILTNKMMLIK